MADELLGLEVVHALRWTLYDAYVESNRPLPVTALKQWSAKLTPEQRSFFEALPTGAHHEPVIDALEAVLSPLPESLPEPVLADVIIPPEGVIRGLSRTAVPAGTWPRHLAEEYLAIHLYLSLVVHRQDWLLGLDGISFRRKLLYQLDLEENGYRPPTSLADWSGRLKDEQRSELLCLPTGDATAQGVISASLASLDAFVHRGQRVLGDEWPADMEVAVCSHVNRILLSRARP